MKEYTFPFFSGAGEWLEVINNEENSFRKGVITYNKATKVKWKQTKIMAQDSKCIKLVNSLTQQAVS